MFAPDNSFAGGSGGPTSAEEVNVVDPAAGTWTVVVHGWQTDSPEANYSLFDWSVPFAPGVGTYPLNVDAAPDSAIVGATGTVQVPGAGDVAQRNAGWNQQIEGRPRAQASRNSSNAF